MRISCSQEPILYRGIGATIAAGSEQARAHLCCEVLSIFGFCHAYILIISQEILPNMYINCDKGIANDVHANCIQRANLVIHMPSYIIAGCASLRGREVALHGLCRQRVFGGVAKDRQWYQSFLHSTGQSKTFPSGSLNG